MTAELEHLAQKRVSELAERYRQQGYQVFVKVRGADSHEVIFNDELDIIVHSEKDAVVVAVKPCTSQPKTSTSSAIEQENLRFKVPQIYDYPVRDAYDIQIYLARAFELIEISAPDSAIRLAVFTAEAVMRLVAEQHGIDFEPQMPNELAETFLERGLISQDDRDVLVKAIELRDRMMYQREKIPVEPKFAYQTIEIVQSLFSQVEREEDEEI